MASARLCSRLIVSVQSHCVGFDQHPTVKLFELRGPIRSVPDERSCQWSSEAYSQNHGLQNHVRDAWHRWSVSSASIWSAASCPAWKCVDDNTKWMHSNWPLVIKDWRCTSCRRQRQFELCLGSSRFRLWPHPRKRFVTLMFFLQHAISSHSVVVWLFRSYAATWEHFSITADNRVSIVGCIISSGLSQLPQR
jgi:hypothetical protein